MEKIEIDKFCVFKIKRENHTLLNSFFYISGIENLYCDLIICSFIDVYFSVFFQKMIFLKKRVGLFIKRIIACELAEKTQA